MSNSEKKAPFFINKENGNFVIYSRDESLENFKKSFPQIVQFLKINDYKGKVLFDYLPCVGTNYNRFIYEDFDGNNFNKDKSEVACLKKEELLLRNDFYLKNHNEYLIGIFELKNEDLKNMLNDLTNYKKPTLFKLMDDILFNSWGLRGDPIIWKEIKENYSDVLIATDLIEDYILNLIKEITGETFENKDYIYSEKHNHGGMSGGGVSSKFWQNKAIPRLIEESNKYY